VENIRGQEGTMPQNGEVNNAFGVYKTLCCGIEIVITQGATFPDCPNHPRLTTEWKPTNETPKEFPRAIDLKPTKKSDGNAA
jgi:hypothetical protein